ncbi:nucleic acid-binding, OB-fold protein [Tanacetum coccineum]
MECSKDNADWLLLYTARKTLCTRQCPSGKYEDLGDTPNEAISAAGFPNHLFDFVLYNELDFKIPHIDGQGKFHYPVLTDYIGCVRLVRVLVISGDPNRRQTIRRKKTVDLIVETSLWGEMVQEFDKEFVETMEGRVIIVLSSSLEVCKHRLEDPNKERLWNRYSLALLLQQNPEAYEKFTCRVTIASVDRSRAWYYTSCYECTRKVRDDNDLAFVSDKNATAMFTFLSLDADAITGHACSELVRKLDSTDPQRVPLEVLENERKRHMFPYQYLNQIRRNRSHLGRWTPPSLELPSLEDAGKTVVNEQSTGF